MIEVKELRIGNWVLENGEQQQIHWIDFEHLIPPDHESYWMPNGVRLRDLSGIPLTTEVLGKCGFTEEYTNGGFLKWEIGEFKILDRRLPHPQYHSPNAIINHLHQLQNLYFALTGQELNYKP